MMLIPVHYCFLTSRCKKNEAIPHGLVVRIRRSHRRGPGSIPGVGKPLILILNTTAGVGLFLSSIQCFSQFLVLES